MNKGWIFQNSKRTQKHHDHEPYDLCAILHSFLLNAVTRSLSLWVSEKWIGVWNSFVNLWFCDSDLTKKNMIHFRESHISVYSLHKATVQLHKTWNIGYTFMIFFVIFFVHVHYWKNGQDISFSKTYLRYFCVWKKKKKKKKKKEVWNTKFEYLDENSTTDFVIRNTCANSTGRPLSELLFYNIHTLSSHFLFSCFFSSFESSTHSQSE